MPPSFDIARGSAADLDALEPLWVAVHHQHVESMPELRPYVTDAETWAASRAMYVELLARPDTVLLLAHADGALVGYGLAHVMEAGDTWLADTWVTGRRVGEIESLSVVPTSVARGSGARSSTASSGRSRTTA